MKGPVLPHRFQRSLQAVEHLVQEARAQPHRELRPGPRHRLTDAQSAGVLVDLHDGAPLLEPDDLAHQARMADDDALVELQSPEVDAHGGAGDPDDAPDHGLSLTW